MYKLGVADGLLRLLIPVALCLTAYLYLYPLFHGCAFPTSDGSTVTSLTETFKQHLPLAVSSEIKPDLSAVPFRLLALADPQLEGDTSLPTPEDALLPKLRRHWGHLRETKPRDLLPLVSELAREILVEDLPETLKGLRKRVDLFGNDHYLGHIYRTLHWWTKPTHVTVLGDLIGSQWVSDKEFEWRGWRFWNRVFVGGHRVDDEVTSQDDEEAERVFEVDRPDWTDQIINIAGNHDIGYAGDVSRARMDRFEETFGKANWDIRFHYPRRNDTNSTNEADWQPSLHLIVLNSLVLDTPALSEDIRSETFGYLNGLISERLRPVEDSSSFTLLLTHLPLHKEEGICVDAPFFDYWPDDDGGGVYKPHGLREQNHLSEETSRQGTLQALFGMNGDLDSPAQGKGRNGLILTGHDHEGCDTWHFIPRDSVWSGSSDEDEERKGTSWNVSRWEQANKTAAHTGVREVTLRSMMGDYGGNAGLLSAWFDYTKGEWRYEVQRCGLNLKVWWAINIIDVIVLALSTLRLVAYYYPPSSAAPKLSAISPPKDQAGVK